jgi:NADH-quinone oxidoreductase subunit H
MRWSYFFMAEYASMFLVSVLAAILFLGGWNTGIGPLDDLLVSLREAGSAAGGATLASFLANLIGMVVIVVKGSLLVVVQIWVRWTFPRLRIDQVMTTCLKYLVPLSCTLFLGAILWPLILVMATGHSSLFRPLGEALPASARRTSALLKSPVQRASDAASPDRSSGSIAPRSPSASPVATKSNPKGLQ